MNLSIINLFSVRELVRVWSPRMCFFHTANTPRVPLCRNTLVLEKETYLGPGEIYNRGKEKCFISSPPVV